MPFIRLTPQEVLRFATMADGNRTVATVFDAMRRRRTTGEHGTGKVVYQIPFRILRKVRRAVERDPTVFGPFQDRINAALERLEEE